jgi:hypothetical protein
MLLDLQMRKNTCCFARRLYMPFAGNAICGNSIPEYTIIALILMFITLAGIQLLSSNLNTAMAKVRDDMKTHQQAAQTVLAAEQAAAAAAANGAAGSNVGLTAAQLALLQQSLADKVQTSGANGATELLAQQLSSTASLLLAEGKISSSQYDILMQLSNQGHQIAQIESLVSNAIAAAGGDTTTLNNMTIYFNGQSYTVPQLAGTIGVITLKPGDFTNTSILSMSPTDPLMEPELGKFISLYNQATSSGALSDPVAQATVTSAAQQIGNLGEVVENSLDQIKLGEVSPTAAAVETADSSAASGMDSSAVCLTGNFQDNGVLCSL